MNKGYATAASLAVLAQGWALSPQAQADGFPGIAMIAPGFGYYSIDNGFDSKLKVYGTLDAFVSYHDSGHSSGTQVGGAGAWTNKLGVYARTPVATDTVLETDVEEGFNLNGNTVGQDWSSIGTLRLAVMALRSKEYGKLEFGKTYGMGTPTFADPFLASYGSPYTYLSVPAAGKGAYYLDLRPKHTVAYTTPSFHGLTLGTAASFGLDDHASEGRTLRGGGAKLQYTNNRVILLASFNRYLSDPWEDGGQLKQTANYYKSLSAFYDFGPISTSLTWQRQDVDEAGSPSTTVVTAGFIMPLGKRDLTRLVLVKRTVEFGSKDAYGAMIGYDHFFTPRLATYVHVGMISNQRNSSVTYEGTPVEKPGDDPQNLTVGVYYHF